MISKVLFEVRLLATLNWFGEHGEFITYADTYHSILLYMRSILKSSLWRYAFSTKKLGIADTAKVIQDKILNITQAVLSSSFRTILKSSEPSSRLETVLLVCSASPRCRQARWSSLDQESEVWHSTWRLIMLE